MISALIRKGIQLFEQMKYYDALKVFLNIDMQLMSKTETIEVYTNIYLLYEKLMDYDSSLFYVKKALEVDESNWKHYMFHGQVLLAQNSFEKSLDSYKKAESLHPIRKGRFFIIRAFFTKPHQIIRDIIDYTNLLLRIAEINILFKKELEAKEKITKILQNFRPDYFPAYNTLRKLDTQEYYQQVEILKKTINRFSFYQRYAPIFRIKKYLQSLYITLARTYLLEMDYVNSEKYFLEAYKTLIDNRSREWLAFFYMSVQSYRKAEEILQNCKNSSIQVDLMLMRIFLLTKNLIKYEDLAVKKELFLKEKNKTHMIRRDYFFSKADLKSAWETFHDRNLVELLKKETSINYESNIVFQRDKKILIITEWGPGDELRWASLYSELSQTLGNIYITCDPRLENILKNSFSNIEFIPVIRSLRGEIDISDINEVPRKEFNQILNNFGYAIAKQMDSVCLITDLLQAWRTTYSDFPISKGLLKPDEHILSEMRAWLATLPKGKINVGICWKSGLIDVTRNINYLDLSCFDGMLVSKDINFINLQQGNVKDEVLEVEKKLNINIYTPFFDLKNDFDRLSALIYSLDLVVSPATYIAELSGALGVETLLFSNNSAIDWRVKFNERDLWYQSVMHVRADPNETGLNSKQVFGKRIVEKVLDYCSTSRKEFL